MTDAPPRCCARAIPRTRGGCCRSTAPIRAPSRRRGWRFRPTTRASMPPSRRCRRRASPRAGLPMTASAGASARIFTTARAICCWNARSARRRWAIPSNGPTGAAGWRARRCARAIRAGPTRWRRSIIWNAAPTMPIWNGCRAISRCGSWAMRRPRWGISGAWRRR